MFLTDDILNQAGWEKELPSVLLRAMKNKEMSFFLDTNDAFIYFNIAKNAQSSLKYPLHGRRLSVKDHRDAWNNKFSKLNEKQVASSYKFTILREPTERMASTYRYFSQRNMIDPRIKFSEFILNYIDCSPNNNEVARFKQRRVWNHHLSPQYPSVLSNNGKIIIDDVILMNDEFENQIHELLQHLGINKKLGHVNKTRKKEAAVNSADISAYDWTQADMSPDALKKFKNFYKKDIELYDKFRRLLQTDKLLRFCIPKLRFDR